MTERVPERGSVRDRVEAVDSGPLVERADTPRAGWAEAAQALRSRDEDGLLDDPVPTVFDDSEWESE